MTLEDKKNKIKMTMYFDEFLINWLDANRGDELSRAAYLRLLVRNAIKSDNKINKKENFELYSLTNQNQLNPENNNKSEDDTFNKLEKLISNKENGYISEEEFKLLKSKLFKF